MLIHLGFLSCSQRQLFRFLEELTAPVVQTLEAQAALVADLNSYLQHDGFRLAMTGKVSGSPIYKVQRAILGSPADRGISAALQAFDPNDVHGRWIAAVGRRADDPQGAITLARTLLEDVCKWSWMKQKLNIQIMLIYLFFTVGLPRFFASHRMTTQSRLSSSSSAAVSKSLNFWDPFEANLVMPIAQAPKKQSRNRDTLSSLSIYPEPWRLFL